MCGDPPHVERGAQERLSAAGSPIGRAGDHLILGANRDFTRPIDPAWLSCLPAWTATPSGSRAALPGGRLRAARAKPGLPKPSSRSRRRSTLGRRIEGQQIGNPGHLVKILHAPLPHGPQVTDHCFAALVIGLCALMTVVNVAMILLLLSALPRRQPRPPATGT